MLLVFLGTGCLASAQDWKREKRVNMLFGLSQVLAHGFNVEGNLVYKRMIFDYSHGFDLRFSGSTVPASLSSQHVGVFMPWTTGFGLGYRWMGWLNTRVEPKWHRLEYYYTEDLNSRTSRIAASNIFSLGIGIYSDFHPFKNRDTFLKGIMISPSVRYWPTLISSWSGSRFYYNEYTGKQEKFDTPNAGLNLSPIIVNISLGYSFDFHAK
jgi:hypothetical protein